MLGGRRAIVKAVLTDHLPMTPAAKRVIEEAGKDRRHRRGSGAPWDPSPRWSRERVLIKMTQETETRYLVVTHNAVTMSRMHRLFGVTMIERGVSRLVSVDLGGAETLLAAE